MRLLSALIFNQGLFLNWIAVPGRPRGLNPCPCPCRPVRKSSPKLSSGLISAESIYYGIGDEFMVIMAITTEPNNTERKKKMKTTTIDPAAVAPSTAAVILPDELI